MFLIGIKIPNLEKLIYFLDNSKYMSLGFDFDTKRFTTLMLGISLIFLDISYFSNGVQATNDATHTTRGLIEIPIAWCAVNGSPAADNPNIPNPSGGFDITTEDVLDRRLERINTNIFMVQAGIKFISNSINNYEKLGYPIIDDQNTTVGRPGDVIIDRRGMQEYVNTIDECKKAWSDRSGRDVFKGIPVININLFVYDNGSIRGTSGIGECAENPLDCGTTPHTGSVMIVDNFYTIPGIPSLPPTHDPCTNITWNFWNKDPMDQMLGHENGHTLWLDHYEEDGYLMKVCQQFTGPGGTIDNIYLNQTEIDRMRDVALTVTGASISNTSMN